MHNRRALTASDADAFDACCAREARLALVGDDVKRLEAFQRVDDSSMRDVGHYDACVFDDGMVDRVDDRVDDSVKDDGCVGECHIDVFGPVDADGFV